MKYTYFTLAEAPGLKNKGMLPTTSPQKDGYGLFYCTNILGDKQAFGGPERTSSNVKLITGVIADFDNPTGFDKNVESFIETTLRDIEITIPIAPTTIVKTAKGLHYTWKFKEPLEPTKELQELWNHIPEFIGSDPACKDFSRVLRVPNSYHWKTGKPIKVELLKNSQDNVYSLEEIKKAFCFVPKNEIKKIKEVDTNSLWVKYNNDTTYTIDSLLTEAGWKLWKEDYYTRPGKEEGVSGHILKGDTGDFFHVFTSSDPKLKEGNYSKYWLLCNLKLNGNKQDTHKYLEKLYPNTIEKQNISTQVLENITIPDFCLRNNIGLLTNALGELEFANLVTAIFLAGGACGKVNYSYGNIFIKPSLYVMLVGAPASGKTSRIDITTEVFQDKEFGIHQGSTPESGQSLVRIACGLKKEITEEREVGKEKPTIKTKMISTPNHQTIFGIDEFYSCVRSAKSQASTLLEKMRSAYMARFLSTASISNDRDLDNGYVLMVINPYVYIIAGITSTELEKLIKEEGFESGGLASRFIFANTIHKKLSQEEEIFGNNKKVEREEIKKITNAIKNSSSDNIAHLSLKDVLTKDLVIFNDKMCAKYGFNSLEEEDAVSNRVQPNVYAIAIIYMRSSGREVLNEEDIEAGWWICRRSIDIYNYHRKMSEQNIFEDRNDNNKVIIRSLIIDSVKNLNKNEGCTANEIRTNPKFRKKLTKLSPEKIKLEIDSLVASEDLKQEEKIIGGRKYVFYFLN